MEARGSSQGLVVVVDDDAKLCRAVQRYLETKGFEVTFFHDGESCLSALTHTLAEAVCLDLEMPGMGGLETLNRIRAGYRHLPVIILTGDTTVQSAVACMKQGAYDYLTKPLDLTKLLTTVRNAVDRYRMSVRLSQLEREVEGEGYPGILGAAPAMKKLYREMDRVAPTDLTVVIYGESGTGKELVARAIHGASGRAKGPFVALNCAAVPEALQESEFFGHEKGAFTGASSLARGKFELAHGGTLFLDEVAECSPNLQTKLLRALQERSFHRVGGSVEIQSGFRLIAATNRNLLSDVRSGRFREDLYFRIAVYELELPPLRDRKEDIPLLAQHFLGQCRFPHNEQRLRLSAEACELLVAYAWPGNIRELENVMQRAALLAGSDIVTPEELPSRLRGTDASGVQAPPTPSKSPLFGESLQAEVASPDPSASTGEAGTETSMTLEQIERQAIYDALHDAQGNVAEAVRRLGVSRTTLYRKLRKYGMR